MNAKWQNEWDQHPGIESSTQILGHIMNLTSSGCEYGQSCWNIIEPPTINQPFNQYKAVKQEQLSCLFYIYCSISKNVVARIYRPDRPSIINLLIWRHVHNEHWHTQVDVHCCTCLMLGGPLPMLNNNRMSVHHIPIECVTRIHKITWWHQMLQGGYPTPPSIWCPWLQHQTKH